MPCKSALERLDKWLASDDLKRFNQFSCAVASGEQRRPDALGLHAPIQTDEVFFDATRTLMKAVTLIPREGCKHRILSLYEPDVALLVRGKSGARVELGDKLWLGETREGLICDYRLEKDAPADTTLVGPALKRLKAAGVKLKRA